MKNREREDLLAYIVVTVVVVAVTLLLTKPVHAKRVDVPPPIEVRIVTEHFPPFQYRHDNRTVGGMYVAMNALCERAKLTCTVELLPWKEALSQAEEGKADVIFSLLLGVPERIEKFILSPPIVRTGYSFFVSNNSKWVYNQDSASLKGMTIGAYGPSGTSIIAKELIDKEPSATLVLASSNLVAFQNLVLGVYGDKSAVVMNHDVGMALLSLSNIVGPKPAGQIKGATFGFGVSRKSPNAELIADKLFAALQSMKKDGTITGYLSADAQFKLSPSFP